VSRPVYTVALLLDPPGERLLLLERAPWKAYAPGRLTGIGGRTEPGESPEAAAWRELREETGLGRDDLAGWRPWAMVACPEEGIELFYCVARLRAPLLPDCREGVLRWVRIADLPALGIIENTAAVLAWVVAQADPPEAPRRGVYRDGVLTWC
jgi:8-oxo-dGTP diphosphatase